MTDWAIYPRDRAAHTTTVTASSGASSAARTVDIDQSTFWEPGSSGGAVKIYGDLGAAYNISAIAMGNTRDTSGRTCQLYKGNTIGALDTPLASFTMGSRKNTLATFNAVSLRYWAINFPGGTSSTLRIGTISVLDSDAKLALASPALADYPSFSDDPGFASAQLATGNPITQVQAGPISVMSFTLYNLAGTESGLFDDVRESLQDHYGWARGVWVTDDSMGATQGRAWYGVPAGPLISQLSPGPYGTVALQIQLLPMGVE